MKNTELLQAIGAVDDRWLLDLDRAMARKVKPRRKLGKTLLLTAAVMALLGATAYAAGFLGLDALRRPEAEAYKFVKTEEGKVEAVENPDGAVLSLSQPQSVPEDMDAAAREKLENNQKAWAEWKAWKAEHPFEMPAVFDPPENTSFNTEDENEDGSVTLRFYNIPEDVDADTGWAAAEKGDYSLFTLLETRTASKEEVEQFHQWVDVMSRDFEGYDYNYGIHTQEQAEALEQIAGNYGLNLRRSQTVSYGGGKEYIAVYGVPEYMSEEDFLKSGGDRTKSTADQLQKLADSTAHGAIFRQNPDYIDHLYYFNENSFGLYGAFKLNERPVEIYLYDSQYATLSSGMEISETVEDVASYEARTHTAPDGTEVTILQSDGANLWGRPASAYLYVYLPDSFLVMSMSSMTDAPLTDAEIDQMADSIAYTEIH